MENTLQTILESLECSYLNLLNVMKSNDMDDYSSIDTEELCGAMTETTKSIVLLINSGVVVPTDKRVYVDIVKHNNTYLCTSEETKNTFKEKLYEHKIFSKYLTIEELITELSKLPKECLIKVDGKKFNIGCDGNFFHLNSIPNEEEIDIL